MSWCPLCGDLDPQSPEVLGCVVDQDGKSLTRGGVQRGSPPYSCLIVHKDPYLLWPCCRRVDESPCPYNRLCNTQQLCIKHLSLIPHRLNDFHLRFPFV